jgi:hypothetical protein
LSGQPLLRIPQIKTEHLKMQDKKRFIKVGMDIENLKDELKTILNDYDTSIKVFIEESKDIGVNNYNLRLFIIDEKYLNRIATCLNNHSENAITTLKTLKLGDE